jgi:hypothetical protein
MQHAAFCIQQYCVAPPALVLLAKLPVLLLVS